MIGTLRTVVLDAPDARRLAAFYTCACRKPMPPGDIHGSRLRRGLAAGHGDGPS